MTEAERNKINEIVDDYLYLLRQADQARRLLVEIKRVYPQIAEATRQEIDQLNERINSVVRSPLKFVD